MNKTQSIAFFRKQLASSKDMKAVAMQNYNLAAQLESEAKRALEMLGASPERTRKGIELSEEDKIKIQSSLIK